MKFKISCFEGDFNFTLNYEFAYNKRLPCSRYRSNIITPYFNLYSTLHVDVVLRLIMNSP